MTNIPIIFSGAMIRALLREAAESGTGKTMTRRLAWTGKLAADGEGFRRSPWQKVKAGDRLWVRENFSYQEIDGDRIEEFGGVHYWADGNPTFGNWTRPKPSIHCPRVASRLTLTVTSTKIERLQDITEADARAEGIEFRENCFGTWNGDGTMRCGGADNAREAFRCLWINLHGTGSWDKNPWVTCLTFKVSLANIDAERSAA